MHATDRCRSLTALYVHHYFNSPMRALLRSFSMALTILLVSATANAQVTGIEPTGTEVHEKPACFQVEVIPTTAPCPGWEQSQACMQNIATIRITNPTNCAFGTFRVVPMPHSQGTNFSVCAGGAPLSRQHCAQEPVMVRNQVAPNGAIEFTIFADRVSDFQIMAFCPDTRQECVGTAHVQNFGGPSPYPTQPGTQPAPEPQPTPTSPYNESGSGTTTNSSGTVKY